jgi:hypothetical protein
MVACVEPISRRKERRRRRMAAARPASQRDRQVNKLAAAGPRAPKLSHSTAHLDAGGQKHGRNKMLGLSQAHAQLGSVRSAARLPRVTERPPLRDGSSRIDAEVAEREIDAGYRG